MVQTSLIVKERDIDSAVAKVKAWLDVDLIRAESQRINRAQNMLAKSFKNFIEPWEYEATRTDLFGNRERLLNKYKNICFQEDEPVYTGRVVNVEWKKKTNPFLPGILLLPLIFIVSRLRMMATFTSHI